jgi:hypothetical protein
MRSGNSITNGIFEIAGILEKKQLAKKMPLLRSLLNWCRHRGSNVGSVDYRKNLFYLKINNLNRSFS